MTDVELEVLRIARWHATYNAALTGIYARGATFARTTSHEAATQAADTMHGTLVPKATIA